MKKDLKIGEHFDYNGVTLKVAEADDCFNGCFFYSDPNCKRRDNIPHCISYLRDDQTDVIFEKV